MMWRRDVVPPRPGLTLINQGRGVFRRCLLLWLVACAAPMAAEPVTVRGGEHGTFSRLVLTMPAGAAWRLGRTPGGYAIGITGGVTFDLTRAFDRIPQSRLLALTPGEEPGRLDLTLGCGCHVTAFQWRPDAVVIDVTDGPPPEEAAFEVPFEGAVDTAAVLPDGPTVLPLFLDPEPATAAEFAAPVEPIPGRAVELQGALLESVARAATEGLLDARVSPLPVADPFDVVAGPAPREPLTESGVIPADPVVSAAQDAGPDPAQALSPDPLPGADHDADHAGLAPVAGPDHDDPPDPIPGAEPGDEADATPAAPETGSTILAETAPGHDALAALATPEPDFSNLSDAADALGIGLITRTSVDGAIATEIATGPDQDRCLPDAYFTIADWAESNDFATIIATRHSALTSEFDTYPDGAIEDLARAYLYFGFGLEAGFTLALDDGQSTERDILRAMAQIIDGNLPGNATLAGQDGCLQPVALWAALARGDLTGTSAAERTAVIVAYRALPPALQGQLSASLAALFSAAGDPVTGAEILSGALGQPGGDSITAALTGVDVALAGQGPDAAIAVLADLAATDERLPAAGLLRLIEMSLAEHRPVDTAQLELARSYRFQARGTEIATALAAAEFRGWLARRAFDLAINLRTEVWADLPPDLRRALDDELVLAAAADMDDLAFATFAFGLLPALQGAGALGAAAANAAAARLIATGFAEQARGLLDPAASGPDMAARRLLRAGADMALGRHAEVIAGLSGLTDARSVALRIAALTARGEFAAALAARGGDASDAALAWRAGDWAGLSVTEDPVVRAAAAAMQSLPPADSATPLATGQALLDQASATRAMADALLRRFVTPVEALAESGG